MTCRADLVLAAISATLKGYLTERKDGNRLSQVSQSHRRIIFWRHGLTVLSNRREDIGGRRDAPLILLPTSRAVIARNLIIEPRSALNLILPRVLSVSAIAKWAASVKTATVAVCEDLFSQLHSLAPKIRIALMLQPVSSITQPMEVF